MRANQNYKTFLIIQGGFIMKEYIKYHLNEMLKLLLSEFLPRELNRYKVFIERPRFIIWIFISFILFQAVFMWSNFFLTLILYIIILRIALSDTVETILRILNDYRYIATRTEKERLLKLFDEVHESTLKTSSLISENMRLYILDDMSINSFALGKNTIAITRGLMAHMDDEALKGVLAHEFGHMASKDPETRLIISIGSTVFLWIPLALQAVFSILARVFTDGNGKYSFIGGFFALLELILRSIINLVVYIWLFIIAFDGRNSEYEADKFAYELGYGIQLISALYRLYDMQMSDKKSLINRMLMGHPRIAYRIGRLERRL